MNGSSDDKSSKLESISEGINEVQEKTDLNGTLEDIRMHLNGLLNTFQEKLALHIQSKEK